VVQDVSHVEPYEALNELRHGKKWRSNFDASDCLSP
jgi:hypothetical protein